ncbi:MAG: hypothetical protein GTN69_03175 [Armatimonadetes bacterium]|nr:hypothetical protein [candidate division Zixibacteria bacterium]NIO74896.1 hypothetical protein [Armatimonadota bacterium]
MTEWIVIGILVVSAVAGIWAVIVTRSAKEQSVKPVLHPVVGRLIWVGDVGEERAGHYLLLENVGKGTGVLTRAISHFGTEYAEKPLRDKVEVGEKFRVGIPLKKALHDIMTEKATSETKVRIKVEYADVFGRKQKPFEGEYSPEDTITTEELDRLLSQERPIP